MKTVIQRVSRASVTIGGEIKSEIGRGYMILLGVAEGDTEEDVDWLVRKIAALRVFDDADGVMNLPITEVGGEILVVSQFTLLASYKKGNRPSWIHAARHEVSIPLYESFCEKLRSLTGLKVGTGEFGAAHGTQDRHWRVRRRHEGGACKRRSCDHLHGHEE